MPNLETVKASKFNPKDTEKISIFDVFSLCFWSETKKRKEK